MQSAEFRLADRTVDDDPKQRHSRLTADDGCVGDLDTLLHLIDDLGHRSEIGGQVLFKIMVVSFLPKT